MTLAELVGVPDSVPDSVLLGTTGAGLEFPVEEGEEEDPGVVAEQAWAIPVQVCVESPMQAAPPFAGDGLVQVRVMVPD
jgi:hypothetical protein